MFDGWDKLVEKIVKHDSWLIQPDILSPPLLRRCFVADQLWFMTRIREEEEEDLDFGTVVEHV